MRVKNAHASSVSVSTVQHGNFSLSVRGTGKLVPREQRWVVSRNESNVDRILHQPGEKVESSTVIIELSNPDVSDAFLAADAAYSAARGDHSSLIARLQSELLALRSEQAARDADYQMAQVEEEAYKRGLESGVIPRVQYKTAQIQAEQKKRISDFAGQRVRQFEANIRTQIASSAARLAQVGRTRSLREVEANALHVVAGLDGTLLSVEVEEGQRIPLGTKLAKVAQPGILIAQVRVPESQATNLAIGQQATIAIENKTLPGRVRRVDPVVTNGTLLVDVDLLGKPPASTRSEQSVDMEFQVARLSQTLYVDRPVNATGDSNSTIFKVTKDGYAERVPVQFGKDSMTQIQILSGLRKGDRIIVSDTGKYASANVLEYD